MTFDPMSVEVTCVTLPKDHLFSLTKIHQIMWIQWSYFSKAWTKGHWPLDDLWPHVCWGHLSNPTQGSLCLSPMGIHHCMWIQWSILQNYHILHTTYIHTRTYYIHTTYYVQNEWSHSLLLNTVQARQKDPGFAAIYVWVPYLLYLYQSILTIPGSLMLLS